MEPEPPVRDTVRLPGGVPADRSTRRALLVSTPVGVVAVAAAVRTHGLPRIALVLAAALFLLPLAGYLVVLLLYRVSKRRGWVR